jgi:Cytochrome c
MKKIKFYALCTLAIIIGFAACRWESGEPDQPVTPAGTRHIKAAAQRPGNATEGYRYLIYGDYVSSGIPADVFRLIFPNSDDDLNRTGDNDGVPYRFNIVKAANGVKVAALTCLGCHAEYLGGQLIVGLGNNSSDYTVDQRLLFNIVDQSVRIRYGENSKEWAAYTPLRRAYTAIGPYILTKVRGVNPADKIFATLAAHRKAGDLTWLNQQQFNVPVSVVPTDVPAWWLLKKKNALYYNGLGTGDFGRLSAASGMLTLTDTAEARRIDGRFADVMAWMRTLTPPKYTQPVTLTLVEQGKPIFERHCSACHGTYDKTPTYPNLLVDTATVGTDPWLARTYAQYPEYHTWYNSSWYAKQDQQTRLRPSNGYVAPPLDGIWATAPYLHNGSVPTLADLLNSPQRPVYWKRNFNETEFDPLKMGLLYTRPSRKIDNETYDTTLPGYGNQGHTFGDILTDQERRALLEYLKTL